MFTFSRMATALALAVISASAAAHVPFLKPNQFEVEHPRLVVESAFTELPFQADYRMDSPHFVLIAPDGSQQPISASVHTRAASYLEPTLEAEGTWRLSTGMRKGPSYRGIETAQGKLYFSRDIPKHTGTPMRLHYQSRADVYLSKGDANYSPRPLNEGVEIIPQTAPTHLHLGEDLRLQVLREGRPVPNARVIVAYDNEHYRHVLHGDLYDVENIRENTLRTDTNGFVTFTPEHAGLAYLLVTIHDKIDAANWESRNAALTLEVQLPGMRRPH